MDDYDVVLYSITSPVDQLSMAAELPDRQERKSRLIVGGQGLIQYGDYLQWLTACALGERKKLPRQFVFTMTRCHTVMMRTKILM